MVNLLEEESRNKISSEVETNSRESKKSGVNEEISSHVIPGI